VSCAVSFVGLTPVALASVVVAGVVAVVVGAAGGGVSSFFTCPGAFAEFPGVAPRLSLLLPFPFPAYAAPANARTIRTSRQMLARRMVLLPFPTSHVTKEGDAVHRT